MSPARPLAVLVAVASSIAGCGGSEAREPSPRAQVLAAQRTVAYPLYWVGTSLGGLALTDVLATPRRVTLLYGTCTPHGDAGCAPPLTIQVSSICDDNALVLDIRPDTRSRARGTTALDYGEAARVELDAGVSHITVSATAARTRRAIAALRPVAGSRPARDALPPPRYPLSYLGELRLVRQAYVRLGDVRAVRTELGISKSAVRFELGLARDLGAARLRQAPAAMQERRTGPGASTPSRGCELEPRSMAAP